MPKEIRVYDSIDDADQSDILTYDYEDEDWNVTEEDEDDVEYEDGDNI